MSRYDSLDLVRYIQPPLDINLLLGAQARQPLLALALVP
jgi:hypothetical protein